MSKSDSFLRSCGDLILLIGKVAVCFLLSSVSVVERLPLGCSDPLLWTGFVSAAAIGTNTQSFAIHSANSATFWNKVSIAASMGLSFIVHHVPVPQA